MEFESRAFREIPVDQAAAGRIAAGRYAIPPWRRRHRDRARDWRNLTKIQASRIIHRLGGDLYLAYTAVQRCHRYSCVQRPAGREEMDALNTPFGLAEHVSEHSR